MYDAFLQLPFHSWSLNLQVGGIGDPSWVYIDIFIGVFQSEGITICKVLACHCHYWDGHPAWCVQFTINLKSNILRRSYEEFMEYMMDIVKQDHRQYELLLDLSNVVSHVN